MEPSLPVQILQDGENVRGDPIRGLAADPVGCVVERRRPRQTAGAQMSVDGDELFAEHHIGEGDVGGGVFLSQFLERSVADERDCQVLVNPSRPQDVCRGVRDERDVLPDFLPGGGVAVGKCGAFLDESVDRPASGDVGGAEGV